MRHCAVDIGQHLQVQASKIFAGPAEVVSVEGFDAETVAVADNPVRKEGLAEHNLVAAAVAEGCHTGAVADTAVAVSL